MSTKLFRRKEIYAGLILHWRGTSLFSRLIRRVLKSWGSHDGMIVRVQDKFYSADSVSPVARIKPLSHVERAMNEGRAEIKVLRVAGASKEQHALAARWWLNEVNNSPYDWFAFPRLLWKATIGNWIKTKVGAEWANWCTEGVADAWKNGAGIDVWTKKNPTPKTTEKRLLAERLEDVTNDMVMVLEDGQDGDSEAGSGDDQPAADHGAERGEDGERDVPEEQPPSE